MSRTICGFALGLGLAVALGCGSKPAPEPQPEPKAEPVVPPPAPAPPAPPPTPPAKVDLPKVAWELDPAKHAIPDAPVSGTLAGVAFAPAAVLEGAELKFRVTKPGAPDADRQVAITLPGPVDDGKYTVKPDELNGPTLPKIFAIFPPAAPGQPGGALFPNTHAFYALTLELGKRKDGKIGGRIYLALQDEAKSVLAGTFVAEVVRPHTEKPGPDDAPYAAGEVTVSGAGADADVRVAYAGFAADGGVFFKELQLKADPLPLDRAGWTRDDTDKPRTSTLVPGDGKTRPFRYEHVKLSPGRYLLSAAVVGGPAVWKWVDVPAGGALAENFALDAAKTGAVEVAAPPDAAGKVYLAPADDAARPALEARLFEGVSMQVVRADTAVVGGKALVKNLGPGRYEVRLGDERRFVDVAAGKTAEVNMTPKK